MATVPDLARPWAPVDPKIPVPVEYVKGGTDVAIADGGTGASTAPQALANLGALPLAGGTMTGDLKIDKTYPVLTLDKGVATEYCGILGQINNSLRWLLRMPDATDELGANAGSNLLLQRYADNGSFLGGGLTIFRDTGNTVFYSTTVSKPGGGTWSDSSDSRIKNIEGAYEKGLSAIVALEPTVFTYKGNDTPTDPSFVEDPNDPTKTIEVGASAPYVSSSHYDVATQGRQFTGLVAQDVETVFPECVHKVKSFIDGEPVTDLRLLDTGPLLYALINAIKELDARLNAIEAPIRSTTTRKK